MILRKINDSIIVSPQIELEDAHEFVRLGFKSIISDLPNGEEDGRPTAGMVCISAEGAGLEFRHVPVVASNISDRDVALFAEAMKDAPKPVLAFCRYGTRAATLWALSQAPSLGGDAARAATKAAGYDLSQLRLRLSQAPNAKDHKSASACDVLLLGAGALGDRRHQAIESRLVSEGRSAATDLLAWHAQGPQMARLPGTEEDAA